MENDGLANDNRQLEHGVLDPDRRYIKEQVAKLCAHLKDRQADRNTVASAFLDEIFKMLEGNPFRTDGDEGAVRADQSFLWSLQFRINDMAGQWDKGWVRIQHEKRPAFRFNRAAPRPKKQPPRLTPPPPDYEWTRYRADLSILGLRPDYAYSEREVLVRYRRRMLKMLGRKRNVEGMDPVRVMVAAKKRMVGYIRRTQGKAAIQA